MLNPNKVDYLILSAVADEQAYVKQHLKNPEIRELYHLQVTFGELHGKHVCVALTGMGTTNAAAVAAALIHEVHPEAFFFIGCAGAIRPDLNVGDMVLGREAFEIEIQGQTDMFRETPFFGAMTNPYRNELTPEVFAGDPVLLDKAATIADGLAFKSMNGSKPQVSLDSLSTSNMFPVPTHFFDLLKQRKSPSIDMESSACYQVSWLLGVPCLVIRSISNGVDDEGSDDTVQEGLDVASYNVSLLMCELIKQPS